MTFGQRLKEAREAKGMNQKQLAEALGITPTRLNYWEKDKRQPEISMIQSLAETLDVTADYLIANPANKKSHALSDEAAKLAHDFEKLDKYSRVAVRAVADAELARLEADVPIVKASATGTRIIPFIIQSMAAGAGEPDLGNIALDTYEIPAGSKAEFACRVHGDSLEPYYHDGDVALAVKRRPQAGEVGVFLVDGEYKLKQYVEDGLGNVYLFALNRSRSDTDQTLWASEDHALYCLGTVLSDKKFPLPR